MIGSLDRMSGRLVFGTPFLLRGSLGSGVGVSGVRLSRFSPGTWPQDWGWRFLSNETKALGKQQSTCDDSGTVSRYIGACLRCLD
jgi:hypothetical protein